MIGSAFNSLYHHIVSLRNRSYDRGNFSAYRSSLSVISIGNISVGGTGKTPLTLCLSQELARKGSRPVILSRGYGGTEKGPKVVSSNSDSALVGDEPLLLARHKETVVVSRDRAAGARFIEKQKLGDLILLDDGHQHRAIERDFNLVMVDCSSVKACKVLLADQTLPFGRLRESVHEGLSRASAIILNYRSPTIISSPEHEAVQELCSRYAPIFTATVKASLTRNGAAASLPNGAAVKLISAIANPEGFRSTVASLGFSILSEDFLRDHSHQVRARILKEAARAGFILCTEKDAVKLGRLPANVFVVEIEPVISDLSQLIARIQNAIVRDQEAP